MNGWLSTSKAQIENRLGGLSDRLNEINKSVSAVSEIQKFRQGTFATEANQKQKELEEIIEQHQIQAQEARDKLVS